MFKVFTEIMYHNSRLAVLGKEAIQVLEVMETEGTSKEVLKLNQVEKKRKNMKIKSKCVCGGTRAVAGRKEIVPLVILKVIVSRGG